MMRVVQIVRVSEQGYSHPYQCYDEEGVLRWCKGNHTGLRSLISEWVCARVARAIGLPVPACDILRLEPWQFDEWRRQKGVDLPVLVTEGNPFVFASTHVENAKDVMDVERDLRVDNPELLAKIFLFDECIRNADRTDCNSNLLSNAGVHVIDHNNAFDPTFEPKAFAHSHILRRFREEAAAETLQAFERQLGEVVTERFLDEAWSEMPDAWTDMGGDVLPLDAIKDVLLRRRG